MRLATAVVALATSLLAAHAAHAANTQLIDCLQSKILITKGLITYDNLAFTITNNLPYAIDGLYFKVVGIEAGSDKTWKDQLRAVTFSPAIAVGETRSIARIVMAANDPQAPNKLDAVVTVLDAAESGHRPIVGDMIITGWKSPPSKKGCRDS